MWHDLRRIIEQRDIVRQQSVVREFVVRSREIPETVQVFPDAKSEVPAGDACGGN